MLNRGPFAFNDVERPSLLVVEGVNDARFFRAFLDWLSKPDVQVARVGGRDNIRPFLLETLPGSPDFPRLRSLGIIRDADDSPASAFQSVQDALRASPLPAPLGPWNVERAEDISVSVAILPDDSSTGSLEDLCLRSIEGSIEFECVEQYMTCIEGNGPLNGQRSKARLHTYLAAQPDPGLRIGEAADAGVWDWESDAFRQVADFLRGL